MFMSAFYSVVAFFFFNPHTICFLDSLGNTGLKKEKNMRQRND